MYKKLFGGIKMDKKDNVRAMLILIEIYQNVQKYYTIEKSIKELQKDLRVFKKSFNFEDNKEMQELFEKIMDNTEQDIKNLKKQ